MTYEKFLETIRKEVQNRADSDLRVYMQDCIKNNDVIYNGLTIMDANFNLAPTIYLNNFYDRYGDDIDSAVEEVLRIYYENKPDSKYDMSFFKVWESVKDKIAYKIVNTEWNSNLLRDVPHISFLDLSVVFYMILEHDDEGNATVLLHNEHLKAWDKTADDLFEVAKVNTQKIIPYTIKDIFDTMAGIIGIDKSELELPLMCDENDVVPMYVITNKSMLYGACAMLEKDLLKNLGEKFGSFIIIPSSVHELIIVPSEQDSCDMEYFSEIINEVNTSQLAEEEVLSDHAYFYNADTNEITYKKSEFIG